MAKRSAGSYDHIEKVISKINNLKDTGFAANDITVIASRQNEQELTRLSEVKTMTPDEGKSLDVDMMQGFGIDLKTIESYNATLRNGGYVILVDGEAEPGEGTLDTEEQPISSPGGGNVPPPGFGVDPRVPQTASDVHGDPMNDRNDVSISDPASEAEREPQPDLTSTDSTQNQPNKTETEDVMPQVDHDSNKDASNINVRPINNTNTPHSPRPEEQTDIPNESLDEDRGKYE